IRDPLVTGVQTCALPIYFSSLRYVTNTAAALPTHHIHQLRNLFPHAKLYSMYGLTECKRVSYLPPDQLDQRLTSVGRGMPNEEVYIVDDSGRRVGPNVIGELVVRGSNVMKGYWEAIKAVVTVRKGAQLTERDVQRHCLANLEDFMVPKFIEFRDSLPKTSTGKISKRELAVSVGATE